MIAPGLACRATSRAASSKAVMLVARPAPSPKVLVGVLTARRIRSAWEMLQAASLVKNRFDRRFKHVECVVVISAPSRATRTTWSKSGSCTGRWEDAHFWMRRGSRSNTSTRMEGLYRARMAAVGPPMQLSQSIATRQRHRMRETYRRIPHPPHRHS